MWQAEAGARGLAGASQRREHVDAGRAWASWELYLYAPVSAVAGATGCTTTSYVSLACISSMHSVSAC